VKGKGRQVTVFLAGFCLGWVIAELFLAEVFFFFNKKKAVSHHLSTSGLLILLVFPAHPAPDHPPGNLCRYAKGSLFSHKWKNGWCVALQLVCPEIFFFSVAIMDLTDGVDTVCHLRLKAPLCFGILPCLCLQAERREGIFVVGYLVGWLWP